MLDLPGIIEGAAAGRGRGREVIAVARSADLVMMVLDGAREQNNQHRDILSRELETMGIRLNRKPPGIYYKKKATGGVKFNTTCTLTQMGDNPQDACSRILGSYRIHNAEVLFREDCSLDDLIDVIEGNRKYVRCLYVYNKIDTLSIEEVDELARKPDSVVISIYMDLNLDFMLQKMWDYLGLIRIYTKRRGQLPDLTEPIVLSSERYLHHTRSFSFFLWYNFLISFLLLFLDFYNEDFLVFFNLRYKLSESIILIYFYSILIIFTLFIFYFIFYFLFLEMVCQSKQLVHPCPKNFLMFLILLLCGVGPQNSIPKGSG